MCFQRIQHGEKETAHLPHRRLWESIWKDIAPASTPALAFGGATFCLQLDALWEEVHTQRRAAETQENTHRCPFFAPSVFAHQENISKISKMS